MHRIGFLSPDPLDHACRALDVVRRMGYGIRRFAVEAHGTGAFRVSMDVVERGELSPATLAARISNIPGVTGLTIEAGRLAARRNG